MQSGFSYVPGVLAPLQASDSSVKAIRAVIGGYQLDNTFNNIVQLMSAYGTGINNPLYANLAALKALGFTGIDLDLEPAPVEGNPNQIYHDYPYYIGGVAQLIAMATEVGLDVTCCPYENEDFWLALLATAYTQSNGGQPVKSMNVQCYWDLSNTQTQWIDEMNSFATESSYASGGSVSSVFGISDPASFIAPGFGVNVNGVGQCPPYFEQQLTAGGFAANGISSAFLFIYSNIQAVQQAGGCNGNNTTADYANALIAGINSVNGVK